MPYPAQVSAESILEKTRELVEREGADQLSLQKLASSLGIKAPSLYRYFPSKTDLLRTHNLQTLKDLTTSISEAAADYGDPKIRLLNLAKAWREFSQYFPRTYALAFSDNPEIHPDPEVLEAMAIPIQRVMAEISGEEGSLTALRGLWALIHGFLLLEISGQFRRGGDLDEAFMQSVEAYLDGWMKTNQPENRK
jgi:AcrR family transcriptional regulator